MSATRAVSPRRGMSRRCGGSAARAVVPHRAVCRVGLIATARAVCRVGLIATARAVSEVRS